MEKRAWTFPTTIIIMCVCVHFLCAIFTEFAHEVNGTNRADISDDYDRPLSKHFASNLLLIDDDCKFMHCIRISNAFQLDCFDMAHCSANAIYDAGKRSLNEFGQVRWLEN